LRHIDGFGEIIWIADLGGIAAEMANWSYTATWSSGADGAVIVAAVRGQPGLSFFHIDTVSYTLTRIARIEDDTKTMLADVSALEVVQVAGHWLVVAASAADGGITVLRLNADNSVSILDSIGAAFGTGWAGTSALEILQAHGTTWVLVGSPGTGDVSLLRLNDLGVLIHTDSALDTLHTRFGGVAEITGFTWNGRAFAVAGGNDGGIALFEIGPDGALHYLQSFASHPGAVIGNILSMTSEVIGTTAQIFLSTEGIGGLHQFAIDLTRFGSLIQGGPQGQVLHGTALDDLIYAGGGNNTLHGGAGNDRLVAGPGFNQLWGGAGADVFVFRPGGGSDRIMDFQRGQDKIDLSAYPMLHALDGFSITPTADGARIDVLGDVIHIRTDDFRTLMPGDLGMDDFIFV
jgi:Ca2+-binding RTX toxin-like protein